MKDKDLDKLLSKYSITRRDKDRGRSFIHVRHDIENMRNMTVKDIITKPSTCDFHDNGGIGHVREIQVGKITKKICTECWVSLVRSKILYE